MRAGRVQYAAVALVAGSALALSACGSTKTLTVTNTVVKENTTTVTTTATETSPGPTTAALRARAGAGAREHPGAERDLQPGPDDGPGVLQPAPESARRHSECRPEVDVHERSCTAKSCQVTIRRLLSDSTIEDLTLFSDSPAGAYTGTIPGGDGSATCGGAIKLSMIVRVGGLQDVSGQTIASRLAGHIFADFQCPGQSPSHEVATYAGTRS